MTIIGFLLYLNSIFMLVALFLIAVKAQQLAEHNEDETMRALIFPGLAFLFFTLMFGFLFYIQ